MHPMTPIDVMRELTPAVESNLNRHLAAAQEWMPHEYVPWSAGRDFVGDSGRVAAGAVDAVARRAGRVRGQPADRGQPAELSPRDRVRFGRDGAWGTWVHRWTAEEGRHAWCMRDYLLVTRAVDPVALERDRMATMEVGYSAERQGAVRVLAYVSLPGARDPDRPSQHRALAEDPIAERLMARISTDENLHMVFYRDLVRAAFEVDPDADRGGSAGGSHGFQMPGTGIRISPARACRSRRRGSTTCASTGTR